MQRRTFIKRFGISLTGFVFAGCDFMNSSATEKMPVSKNEILEHPLCPSRLLIDEIGWEAFLKQWDKEAFEFLKTEILNFGIEKVGKPDSYIQHDDLKKQKYEEYIRRTEMEVNSSLPRELFYGGVIYPPKTLLEEQIAEEKFRNIQEALKKLLAYNNLVYGDAEQRALINGSHLLPPASEQEIQTVETCFGVQLPRSYRDFLKVSNGSLLGLHWELLPVDKIGRTREINPQFNEKEIAPYLKANQDVPDTIYYQYDDLGMIQEPFPYYRVKKFFNALLISNPHELEDLTDIYPCYPKSPYDDGEWEVFYMDGWRFRSFKHMMEYMYLFNIIEWRLEAETWEG